MTWNDIALRHPEFVQWCVARFGPLLDDEVRQEQYEAYAEAWTAGREGTTSNDA